MTYLTVTRPSTVDNEAWSSWNVAFRWLYSTNGEVNVGNEAYSPFDHFATTLSSASTARSRAD